jgi:hypothetical protein
MPRPLGLHELRAHGTVEHALAGDGLARRVAVAIPSTAVEAPMLAPTNATRCGSTPGRRRSQRTALAASRRRSASTQDWRDW